MKWDGGLARLMSYDPTFAGIRKPTNWGFSKLGLEDNIQKSMGRKPADLVLPNLGKHQNIWRLAEGQTPGFIMDKARSPEGRKYGPAAGGLIGSIWGPFGAFVGSLAGTKISGGGQTEGVKNGAIAAALSYLAGQYMKNSGSNSSGSGPASGNSANKGFFGNMDSTKLINFGTGMMNAGQPSTDPQSGSMSYAMQQGMAGANGEKKSLLDSESAQRKAKDAENKQKILESLLTQYFANQENNDFWSLMAPQNNSTRRGV